MRQNQIKWLAISICSIVLLCVALDLISLGSWYVSDQVTMLAWEEAEGTVTDVKAVEVPVAIGFIRSTRDKLDVTYTYTVDGIQYDGHFTTEKSLSTGTQIPVFYDPGNPSESKGDLSLRPGRIER